MTKAMINGTPAELTGLLTATEEVLALPFTDTEVSASYVVPEGTPEGFCRVSLPMREAAKETANETVKDTIEKHWVEAGLTVRISEYTTDGNEGTISYLLEGFTADGGYVEAAVGTFWVSLYGISIPVPDTAINYI